MCNKKKKERKKLLYRLLLLLLIFLYYPNQIKSNYIIISIRIIWYCHRYGIDPNHSAIMEAESAVNTTSSTSTTNEDSRPESRPTNPSRAPLVSSCLCGSKNGKINQTHLTYIQGLLKNLIALKFQLNIRTNFHRHHHHCRCRLFI